MSNDHIADYLNYYIDLPPAPGYAVMINGPWGVGKTYLIQSIVERLTQGGKKIFWVSLHGVQSTDEIDQRLIAALSTYVASQAQKGIASQAPIIDDIIEKSQPYIEKALPFMESGGRIISALIKRSGVGGLLQASGLRNAVTPDLIVFDDLERGELSARVLLGYINQFVELEGRKVVIIANENDIEDENYRTIREKVIGETFDFQEDLEPPLRAFIQAMPNDRARRYVESNIDTLRSIFRQAECKSLRVVRQVLLTWDRFYRAIDAKLRERVEPMLLVFRLFTAICTEVRLGHLSASDLENRVFKIVSRNMGKKEENSTPLAEADGRYPELFLHDTVLTDEVLIHAICEGRIDPGEINRSLGESAHFKAPEGEPAWQKVWWGLERDPKEFEAAFVNMEKQFKAREFVDPGTVLHVFGLRLWGADMGQLKLARADVVAECRQYVDDLAKTDRLLGAITDRDAFRHGAAGGLGFMSVETNDFKGLYDYYWQAIEDAKKRRWPAEADVLLDLMGSDIDAFCAKIAWTSGSRENTYQSVPVFSSISAGQFVDRVMNLSPADLRTALTALKERYVGNRLAGELQLEQVWLREVRDALLKEAEGQVPIRKFAIRNEVKRLLSPFFDGD